MLAFDRARTGRLVVSAVLFALAVLTRETIVPFALAGAAALALDGRRWRRAAAFAAATCGPLLVWRLVVAALDRPADAGGRARARLDPAAARDLVVVALRPRATG